MISSLQPFKNVIQVVMGNMDLKKILKNLRSLHISTRFILNICLLTQCHNYNPMLCKRSRNEPLNKPNIEPKIIIY